MSPGADSNPHPNLKPRFKTPIWGLNVNTLLVSQFRTSIRNYMILGADSNPDPDLKPQFGAWMSIHYSYPDFGPRFVIFIIHGAESNPDPDFGPRFVNTWFMGDRIKPWSQFRTKIWGKHDYKIVAKNTSIIFLIKSASSVLFWSI